MKNRITGFAGSNKRLLMLVIVGGILLAACAASERHEQTIWYVATTGSDSNTCAEPDLACRTIVEAFRRADADDQINIAAGTYAEVARYEDYSVFANIDFDLRVVGAGANETIIDLGNTYAGFYVLGGGRLRLEDLTVQNARGNSPGGCIMVVGNGEVNAENVNLTRCLYAGIVINDPASQVNLVNVSITESVVREPYGAGAGIYNRGNLTIEGGEISRNPNQGISSTGILEINGTLIEDNLLEGLFISGEATLSGLTVQDNGGDLGHYDGIVILGGAAVELSDSLVTANDARGIHIYGEDPFNPLTDGLPASGPRVSILNSMISDHRGDGIFIAAGTLTLNGTTLQGNAYEWGRALDNREGFVEIRNSHITGNGTGTIQIGPDGEMNIFETTIDDNSGDYQTIFNEGTMNMQNTLVANNVSALRAIENDGGDMLIANSTISGNLTTGIVAFRGNLTLSYVTIADNTGTGFAASNFGEIHLLFSNILVARNGLGDCNLSNPDAPDVILAGVNIATDHGCTFPTMYSADEILLDALADNGGSTLTHALLPGSPAMDAATGTCLEVDQRFVARPVGPACDVGAYEAGASATSLELTATPETDTLIVKEDFPCYTGPGPQYNTLSTLKAGTQLPIVGYSFGGGWFVVSHPTLQGSNCWIDEDFVETTVSVGDLRLIAVPPKPTSTPTPEKEEEPTACPTQINNKGVCQ